MLILIIGRGYPTVENPQKGNFEFTQAKALQKSEHDVIYASVRQTSLRKFSRAGIYYHNNDGIPAYKLCYIIPYGRLPNWFFYFFGKRQMKKLYKKIERRHGRPDLVHSHYLRISALASVLKRRFKLPLVITEHWSVLNNKRLPFEVRFLGKRTYNHSDLVISVSDSLRKQIEQHFGVECKVINNMVDSIFFDSPSIIKNNQIFYFISVGSLIPIKGYDVLIKAFKKAFSGKKNVKMRIVGKGFMKNELVELTKSLDISEQVIFTGQKTSCEIRELLADSDVFSLASRAETFGVVFIEALAQGLPVIGTKCGGPEEIVDKSNGILVDVDDIGALCNAMSFIYDNRNNFDAEKIAWQCKQKFSQESVVKRLIIAYKSIL